MALNIDLYLIIITEFNNLNLKHHHVDYYAFLYYIIVIELLYDYKTLYTIK